MNYGTKIPVNRLLRLQNKKVTETENDINITLAQYDDQIAQCREIFFKKTKDYGTSWRIMRPRSITDQLFIKGQRIRTLEETGISKVDEGIEGEFRALVNYGLMALIQLSHDYNDWENFSDEEVLQMFEEQVHEVRQVMIAKNHDYGEAWREMRTSSFTDLILTKILRIKQIEDNEGQTLISEGLDGHYTDIVNYAVFALIRMNEE